MSADMQPFIFEGADIRIATGDDGRPWWALVDVCDALGLSNSRSVATRLRDAEKNTVRFTDTDGRPHDLTLINDSGLYRLIFRSNKPEAERFQDWVFQEVLPELQRTGSFGAQLQPTEKEERFPDGRVVITRYGAPTTPAEPKALPPADPFADSTVELADLRKRFDRAIRHQVREAIGDHSLRGATITGLNSMLKNMVMCSRPRKDWSKHHYSLAVQYLEHARGWDLAWIFK